MKLCARCRRRQQRLCIDCEAPAEPHALRCAVHLRRHSQQSVASNKRVRERARVQAEQESREAREAWL